MRSYKSVIIVHKVLCLFPHLYVASVCVVLKCLVLAEQPAFGEFQLFHCDVQWYLVLLQTNRRERWVNQQTGEFVLLVWYRWSFVDMFCAECHFPLRALMLSHWGQRSSLCVYISCFISLLIDIMSFPKYIIWFTKR